MTIDGASFVPVDLTAAIGDSIVFVNKDPYPHTVAAKSAGIDSPAIASGKSWQYTATAKGTHPYTCTIHPSMKGTIHVE